MLVGYINRQKMFISIFVYSFVTNIKKIRIEYVQTLLIRFRYNCKTITMIKQ